MSKKAASMAPGFSTDMPAVVSRPTLPEPQRSLVLGILAEMKQLPGALLPILHAIQDELGYIPPESVVDISEVLGISRAEIHGVVTFYPHFRTRSAGRHHVQICRAESCQAMGADKLIEHATRSLACTLGETTPDGRVTVEPVYCLGLCAQSPAITIDGRPHARVTPEKFDVLIKAMEASS